ncbi:UNVERIFIED_CONTAM: Asp-tRNA(Asn)/Glu-tRNA(Gln) amidotransferase C subunit [Brevibacillus sp. OAP136]
MSGDTNILAFLPDINIRLSLRVGARYDLIFFAFEVPFICSCCTVIDYYLSTYHRDQTEMGCILPALSSEISRSSEEVRQVFIRELQRIIDFISTLAQINKSTGSAVLSMMVGTLVLARSVNDSKLSDSLLEAGKQQAKGLIKTNQ